MRGYNGKTTKVNMTDQFSFQYGVEGEFISQLDNAAKALYEALGDKSKNENEQQDLLTEITNYFESCILLDDKLVWEYVEKKSQTKDQPEHASNSPADKLEIKKQVAKQFLEN